GLAAIGHRVGKSALVLLVAFLVAGPTAECLDHQVRNRFRGFDPHADLRRDLFTTPEFLGEPTPPSPAPARPSGSIKPLVGTDPRRKGGLTPLPPFFRADWWAQRPPRVQLAEVSASGMPGRSPRTALRKAWTRCGCEPPWPPPWVNERCCSSSRL